jgi:hypothetical protein
MIDNSTSPATCVTHHLVGRAPWPARDPLVPLFRPASRRPGTHKPPAALRAARYRIALFSPPAPARLALRTL